MSSPEATVRYIQKSLEPYVRIREQAAYIRRVLALHLQACVENSQPGGPLSLVDEGATVMVGKECAGLEREYLKALAANLRAKEEFETVRKAHQGQASGVPSNKKGHAERLDDQLYLIRLQQKAERLRIIHRHLDGLSQQPAASEELLNLESVFRESKPLPKVPSKIVDSFAPDGDASQADLAGLASRLDKVLLRSKLLLKREERLLEEVKAASSIQSGSVSNGAKLRALDITRNELINWIEVELSKAAGEDDDAAEDDVPNEDSGDDAGASRSKEELKQRQLRRQIDEKLEEARKKYEHYVGARKALILALSQPSSMAAKSVFEPPPSQPTDTEPVRPKAVSHLLIPYLENMLSVSREQKALIAQKSHLNITLAKQLKEACQTVDHLAEESQLLPRYPMPDVQRGRQRSMDNLTAGATEKPDLTSLVKRWVYSSDSAKIATLEVVAEKIDEGQLGIEGTIANLDAANKLLGRETQPSPDTSAENEQDIWLDSGGSGKQTKLRRRSEMAKMNDPRERDIWSEFHLDLGLIGHENRP